MILIKFYKSRTLISSKTTFFDSDAQNTHAGFKRRMQMKLPILLLVLILPYKAFSAPIDCVVESDRSVSIRMSTPHPKEALIHRPNGDVVWLQLEGQLRHKEIENFESVGNWKLTPESKGTVYSNGEAAIQNVINSNGKYYLYIAENTETESENTSYIDCYFSIN